MKLPNGFGSVYKLSGNRRKPWTARKTVGWTFDEERGKSYPVYQFIGYYASRKEALTALSDYNKDPYDLESKDLTFADVYELWSDEHFPRITESNRKGYRASFKAVPDLHDRNIREIKLNHLQRAVDASGKNKPTLRKIKTLYNMMWDYCVIHEILPPEKKNMIQYLDISQAGNPNKINRSIFSTDEIEKLWNLLPYNDRIRIPLFLIYTGVRIGEFYNLKKSDINIKERFFQVTESKTEAGIREVPIAEKIVPLITSMLENSSDYLCPNLQGRKHTDKVFRKSWWNPLMQDLDMDHLPHDTRHTCVSLLTVAGVDERIIKKIVGHKGQGITQSVYTHLDLPAKLEAINKI